MNEVSYYHSFVAVKDQLFALGSDGRCKFEVYDIASKQLTISKIPPLSLLNSVSDSMFRSNFFLIGNKIVSITEKSSIVYSYDISKGIWTVEYCENSKDIIFYHFIIIRCL